jgi:transcriptional regulator with XRE-family HTH domain
VEKSVSSKKYKLFLRELVKARRQAGVTQVELAKRLKATQTFVSKCERGERRIDVIELREFCYAMGVSFNEFTKSLDRQLKRAPA